MTAPARATGPGPATSAHNRTRTPPPTRERTGKPAAQPIQPERTATRSRSAAVERAYARRAQRTERATGFAVGAGVKTERKPGSASRATFVVLVMVLLVGGVVATLWFSTQATADAYRLEQAKKDTAALAVRVAQLQRQVAAQDSAPSLGNRALQLGMVPAGDPAHLVVGPDGTVTMIGTPSVAKAPPPPPTTTPPTTTPPASATTTTTAPTSTTPTNPATGG
ncbi:MAG TPA: hypothetical protein VH352_26415 [Pseudonocardiaceae bacterium]|jgi:hypothetical protein|nr:hypothetical protein [Pseudonocardiaceae bacterium]